MSPRKSNAYVATVWSRHSGRREEIGIWAPNKVLAREKVEHEVGKVISIVRVNYMPSGITRYGV